MRNFLFLPPTFKHLFQFGKVIDSIDKYLEPHQMIIMKRVCKLIKNKVSEASNFLNIFQHIQINDDYCQFFPRQKLISWYIKQFDLNGNIHPQELSIKTINQLAQDKALLDDLIYILATQCSSLLKLRIENTPFEQVKIIFEVNKGKLILREFTNIQGEIGDGVKYLEEILTLRKVYIQIDDISKFESLITKYVEINLIEDLEPQRAFFVNQNIRRQALDMGILLVYDNLSMSQYKMILKDVKQLYTIRIYDGKKLSDYFFDFLIQNKYYEGLNEFVFRNCVFSINSIVRRFFNFFHNSNLESSLVVDFTGCDLKGIQMISQELIKNNGIESIFYGGEDLLRRYRTQKSKEREGTVQRDVRAEREAYQFLQAQYEEEMIQKQLLLLMEQENERSSLMD
ncbi:UNKNOWN [Stylonychia lemnae]|uniref:Uncharacterized protein n=1 Tax=Stylonychia lemnae TaxID=5949 RepID=A0A078A141_STYLE|nr:UNKNOWN [Stylonychia lemnae]|eukprot:CDW75203.1 UNKNOWN [Stylonychia lemnae]